MSPVSRYCCFYLSRCQYQLLFSALLWCLFSNITLSAQYRFDSWTTDNGLPQGSVNSITQTHDGFLWFTTFGGLVRYDGLRFQVFNSGNTKGLKSGRFTQITEDHDKNLWIATEAQGLTRYKDGIFTTFSTENGLSGNLINRMEDKTSQNFLLNSGNTLLQWNGENFVSYLPAEGEPTTNIMQRKSNGAIWYLEDSHLRKFENGKITVDFKPNFTVHRSFEDSQGRVWIAGNQNELFMLKDGKLLTYTEKDGFPRCRFITVIEDQRGRILFATPLGLLIFEDGKFSHFTTKDGLIDNGLTSLLQDHEGTIWMGTIGGLSRLTEAIITPYSTKNGLANDNVYSIFQDRHGKIWIGSWNGLTTYENGIFHDAGKQFGLANDNIVAIYEDRDDYLWISTWSGKIIKTKNNQFTTLPPNPQIGEHIRAIYQDRTGNMWFGTNKGLVQLKNDEIKTFDAQNGLLGKAVYVIYEDNSGQLWIGTDAGLTKYQNGLFTPFKEESGISENIVRSIYEDKEGTLWIGMYDSGLYRYREGKFTHYNTENGLFDNGVFQIIEDQNENFWISCNLGIYRVKKAELNDLAENRLQKITSVPYNKRDGMLNSECNGGSQPAGIMTQSGQIWFPTQKGIAVIDPKKIPLNNQPPPVVIESLIVDTKSVNTYLPVKIQPEQTNLEIHYSGLSFINPELVKFKYKLDGLDSDWIDAGSRRTAYYTHLPPGKYRFNVLAANRDGVWNDQGANLEITVLPPFWRTWWFSVLVVFTMVGFAYAYYRHRTMKLEKERAAQQFFSQQLIESQEQERRRIAAELHDGIGQSLVILKNRATISLNTPEDHERLLAQMEEISDGTSTVISEVRGIARNLHPFQIDLLGLTTALKTMIDEAMEVSDIKFTHTIDEIDGFLSKEAEINLYRIVQEAVNNVIKHSNATITNISLNKNEQTLDLIIEDNGKGFSFDSQNQERGFGLIGISERANMLNAQLEFKSSPENGTTIYLQIKM